MNDWGKLILRLGASALMLTHGFGKLMKLIENGTEASFADPLGVGAFATLLLAILAEVICPLAIILGWKTRLAAVPPIITMAIAVFMIHADDGWGRQELPLLFLFAFVAIALLGAGKLAIEKS